VSSVLSGLVDGEAVILGVDGVPDFNVLHSRKHDDEVQPYAFDILTLDGAAKTANENASIFTIARLLTDQSKLTNHNPWQDRGNLIVMGPWNGRCPFSGERVMLQLLQTICCVR
jgi:hypothetical protein